MEVPALIASVLVTAFNLQPWVMNLVTRVADAAEGTLFHLLGFISAALVVAIVLYVICTLINVIAAPFTRGKTVGQIVARSLAKTMGGMAAAWTEGWTVATNQGHDQDSDTQHHHKTEHINASAVCEHKGLRLVAGESSPTFKPIVDVKPEPSTVQRTHDRVEEAEDDRELTENNWKKVL
ncbi:uncharacterized protein CC84DRAFT_1168837 [Paraphaeosphaeria sporulosa]|uniref:Uncharacterized protein n=1 Tax=Paraphaeosphaeria sporulosa TaxID=1460663 RepID=A0A177BX90_9PLEO|nr:uncharacterized protein CC84DRAFT_1168837 [Paraphaeosphaeria sporulosa]OAF99924.1 hypothetical protein CC84DRAFT_1168837 [Paraphaeosphaeria sporulosa]